MNFEITAESKIKAVERMIEDDLQTSNWAEMSVGLVMECWLMHLLHAKLMVVKAVSDAKKSWSTWLMRLLLTSIKTNFKASLVNGDVVMVMSLLLAAKRRVNIKFPLKKSSVNCVIPVSFKFRVSIFDAFFRNSNDVNWFDPRSRSLSSVVPSKEFASRDVNLFCLNDSSLSLVHILK